MASVSERSGASSHEGRREPQIVEFGAASALQRFRDVAELAKPRVVAMVLLTTCVSFYLASDGTPEYVRLLQTLLGTALAAAGTMALNQYMERDLDALMQRTRSRPLPDNRLQPTSALIFGVTTAVAGLAYLCVVVNWLCALVTAATTVGYLFAYTPLKRRTPFCTLIGAIPGALPPVTGWTAARGDLGVEAWILFAILFLWQLPHSLAIACLYRDDYARAGIRLLPVVEPDSVSTGRQIVINSLALLAVGLLPTFVGLTGAVYFVTAAALGVALLAYSVAFAMSRTLPRARHLLFASLVYLPVLLSVMALDKVATTLAR